MVYTPDRAKQIAYSEPYFNGGVAAAYRPDKPIKQPTTWSGRRSEWSWAARGDKFVRDNYGTRVTIKTYDTCFSRFKDLGKWAYRRIRRSVAPMRYIMRNTPALKSSATWDNRIQAANTRLEDEIFWLRSLST